MADYARSESFAESMPTYDKIGYVSKTFAGVDIDRHAIRTAVTASTAIPDEEVLANLEELSEDVLILAPPNLHGFSLSDKMWRELTG